MSILKKILCMLSCLFSKTPKRGDEQFYAPNLFTCRAWAVLPAAPTLETTAETVVAGWEDAMFYIAYQRGGAGGAARIQMQTSPYSSDQIGGSGENWFTQSLQEDGSVVRGQTIESLIQRNFVTFTSQWGGVETIIYGPINFAQCAERIRFIVTDTQTVPGYLEIKALRSTDN